MQTESHVLSVWRHSSIRGAYTAVSFCNSCLQPLISASAGSNTAVICPLCRQPTQVPDDEQFLRNLALVDAIEEVKELKEREYIK